MIGEMLYSLLVVIKKEDKTHIKRHTHTHLVIIAGVSIQSEFLLVFGHFFYLVGRWPNMLFLSLFCVC